MVFVENKIEDAQVCITIYEARHLAWPNMNPVVYVEVGEIEKCTQARESTDNPFYNEFFVFDFDVTFNELLDLMICISVYHVGGIFLPNKLLGSVHIDVATIWLQEDHCVIGKWAPLIDPDDFSSPPNGFVKCDIRITTKGEIIELPPMPDEDAYEDVEDIEENLIIPDSALVGRHGARYEFSIYRLELRAPPPPVISEKLLRALGRSVAGEMYIEITFGDLKGETTSKAYFDTTWDEKITFLDVYPPLVQRIKFRVHYVGGVWASFTIEINSISNSEKRGFLPTFGPAITHLYGPLDRSPLTEEAVRDPTYVDYRGKLLWALETHLDAEGTDTGTARRAIREHADPLEITYWELETIKLVAVVFGGSLWDSHLLGKHLNIELSMGNEDISNVERLPIISKYTLENISPASPFWKYRHFITKYFKGTLERMESSNLTEINRVNFPENKPCVYLKILCPVVVIRMYNTNYLLWIANTTKWGVRKLRGAEKQSPWRLRRLLGDFLHKCKKYLSRVELWVQGVAKVLTALDKHRIRLCYYEVVSMMELVKEWKSTLTNENMSTAFNELQVFVRKLESLAENPQDSLPDVNIWLRRKGKRYGIYHMKARRLLYSDVVEERGDMCGKIRTICFQVIDDHRSSRRSYCASFDLFLWLGIRKESSWVDMLPPGRELWPSELGSVDSEDLIEMTGVTYKNYLKFKLRAHIYQARILMGSDASGACDPYLRVSMGDQCTISEICHSTLNPLWNQTLVFPCILLPGNSEEYYIKNAPCVFIELMDENKTEKSELLGSVFKKVRMTSEKSFTLTKLRSSSSESSLKKETTIAQYIFVPAPERLGRRISRAHESVGRQYRSHEPPEKRPAHRTTRSKIPDEGSSEAEQPTSSPLSKVSHNSKLHEYMVSPNMETYDEPSLTELEWIPVFKFPLDHTGDVLAAFELERIPDDEPKYQPTIEPFPSFLAPKLCPYRFEVVFWGVRDFERSLLSSLGRPAVMLECGGQELTSQLPRWQRSLRAANFPYPLQRSDIMLPMDPEYRPAITIKVLDSTNFRRPKVLGCYIIENMEEFIIAITEKPSSTRAHVAFQFKTGKKTDSGNKRRYSYILPAQVDDGESTRNNWMNLYNVFKDKRKIEKEVVMKARKERSIANEEDDEDTQYDWWTKYYTGLKLQRQYKILEDDIEEDAVFEEELMDRKRADDPVVIIYPNELESQPEFANFMDWLHTFPIYSGKWRVSDQFQEATKVGKFKGSIIIYKLIGRLATLDVNKYFAFNYPSNKERNIIVRVYVVKAIGLYPMDYSGKSDPYVEISLGKKSINDRENYVPRELNPVFGRCFELEATLPQDYILTVRVMDMDVSTKDDLIGETRIDLENRYFSFHRGTCGLASRYDEFGYNAWRDSQKPSEILKEMCRTYKISGPHFNEHRVTIGSCTFSVRAGRQEEEEYIRECLCLKALHHWQYLPVVGRHLVPEHVETRSLFHPDEPGIERGKLQLWVDLLREDDMLPAPVDISPRKPCFYELRCIVWNVEDVILTEDDFFTGETVSDIYVKGWLADVSSSQQTDVHYRSLNGEGMFNWRFVFPFEYLSADRRMVLTRKMGFTQEATRELMPCHLCLQVWDNDCFSADDYLGMLTLNLLRIPRGAKEASLCTLRLLESSTPTLNLFKIKSTRGWWPFQDIVANTPVLVGKVELELEIVTEEQSLASPAGKGRSEPDKLPEPNRPYTSFSILHNPVRAFVYLLWHRQKWRYLRILILILIVFFVGRGIYSIPEYTVKKLIGA